MSGKKILTPEVWEKNSYPKNITNAPSPTKVKWATTWGLGKKEADLTP